MSVLDIFLMSALYRTLFLSKEEVAHYPVIGIAARLIGIYFLKRESPFDRHRVIRKIASQSNGRIITIFPQGTTSALENLLPFKRGIFKTVELNHGTILLPAAIRYRKTRPSPGGGIKFSSTMSKPSARKKEFTSKCRLPSRCPFPITRIKPSMTSVWSPRKGFFPG